MSTTDSYQIVATARWEMRLPPPRGWRVSEQQRVELAVLDAITAGTLPPGAQLPSVKTAARTAAVSVNTVTNAYRALAADGVLEARRRSGFFVSAAPAYSDFFAAQS